MKKNSHNCRQHRRYDCHAYRTIGTADRFFPSLPEELQKHLYFEFGSIEDHFKYRQAVIEAYPCGNYSVFEGYDHMQYQIRDPKGFAEMLAFIAEQDGMPKLPFIRK